jgi:hypothetical protein
VLLPVAAASVESLFGYENYKNWMTQ